MKRIVVVLVLVALGATACGGVPTKEDFVAKVKPTIGNDLVTAMVERGIEKATATKIIDDFIGCQYDSIKSDEALLQQAYDKPGDPVIAPELDSHALKCTDAMTAAITKDAIAPPPTTTVAPPYPNPLPTTVPTVPLDTTTTIATPTTTPDTTVPETSAP